MLITVYIPTKNRAELLSRAIESVRAQTHQDLELVVVDDGSTDETPSLLAGLAAQEPRLRYITHDQSQGGAVARNAAITAAQGEFVTGLDDDDTFTSDRLERFANTWHECEKAGGSLPSALYSQLNRVQNGVVIERTHKPASVGFNDMFRENVIGNQIFAPRPHYIDAGLFRVGLPAWQDLEFFMRVLKTFGRAKLVDAATYNWDDSPRIDRISRQSEEKLRLACQTVSELHQGLVPRRTQLLYLQLFGRYYGVKPTINDWRNFLSHGLWPTGCVRLLHAHLG